MRQITSVYIPLRQREQGDEIAECLRKALGQNINRSLVYRLAIELLAEQLVAYPDDSIAWCKATIKEGEKQ